MNGYQRIPDIPTYLINKEGSIYSSYVNRVLSPYINNKGYLCIKLRVDKKTRTLLVSRLLAHTFLELENLWDEELHVDHIDRDTSNNTLGNLQVMNKEAHYVKTTLDNNLKVRAKCKVCGNIIYGSNTKFCAIHAPPKEDGITEELIRYWVTGHSWTRASAELGMSDNGLRKRFKKLTGMNPKSLKRAK